MTAHRERAAAAAAAAAAGAAGAAGAGAGSAGSNDEDGSGGGVVSVSRVSLQQQAQHQLQQQQQQQRELQRRLSRRGPGPPMRALLGVVSVITQPLNDFFSGLFRAARKLFRALSALFCCAARWCRDTFGIPVHVVPSSSPRLGSPWGSSCLPAAAAAAAFLSDAVAVSLACCCLSPVSRSLSMYLLLSLGISCCLLFVSSFRCL